MIRIATWNLESVRPLGADRKAAFYDAIEKRDADVWILTETWVATSLEPLSNYVMAAQSLSAEDLASSPERCWVSIWVRNTIAHTPVEIHAQQDRMAAVHIKIPKHPAIVVVGTVLPWLSDKLWLGADGFCSAVAVQSAEWTRIHAQHDDCTFLVAGDFNQSLPGVSRYGSKDGEIMLSAALRHRDLFCLTPGLDTLTGRPRIDHICISRRGLQSPYLPNVSEWAVPFINGKPITDHVGIAAEIPTLPVSA
ncbi:endonuclease/exonuclease/phosphatase family protein [Propionivibrio sp.]|uniref:endonuclease/exonuclease/phosphatase family protein n=1 Tax=Propionivibrio sp. TaxID=2212460 RepID=UPI003BF0BBFD